MKTETRESIVAAIGFALVVVCTLAFASAFVGCTSTVTPSAVASHDASYDGNQKDSGVLSLNANGYVVTSHFRDRYNALVRTYGGDFKPSISKDAGVTDLDDGTFLIDRQHMSQFLEMNAWLRAGLHPSNP